MMLTLVTIWGCSPACHSASKQRSTYLNTCTKSTTQIRSYTHNANNDVSYYVAGYSVVLCREEQKHTRLDLESWQLGFRELMRDFYGKQLFASFLAQEYAMENLHFYEACEDLKQCPQSKVAGKIERIRR